MKIVRLPLFAALGAVASAAGCARAQAGHQPIDWSTVSLDSIGGGPMPTADYRSRVVLLVNTASRCGFTSQYRGLEASWRRYKDQGLVVLGVPSNDFGGQEPDSNDEIRRFCEATFDVTFPLVDKQIVSGPGAHPLYRWAAARTGTLAPSRWRSRRTDSRAAWLFEIKSV